MLTITQLWVYPIKSCQGIAISSTNILPSGLKHDREMMIIDEKDRFVTQRSNAILAHIGVALSKENHVRLDTKTQTFEFKKQYINPH